MKHEALVSIITPAWNAAPFLRETYESIRAQTHTRWDWIVVDDGSSDGTGDIADSIAAADTRVTVIRLPQNLGQAGRVRNVGLDAARGDFIAFLDADDGWHPDKLARQIDHLHAHPAVDIVCTYIQPFGDTEGVGRWRRMMWRPGTLEVTKDQILLQSMATSSILMRRRCYDEIGGMEEDPRLVIGEDTEYGLRLVMRFTAHRLREALTYYRVREAGASLSSIDAAKRFERALALHQILADKNILPPELLRRHRALTYYNEAKNNLFHHKLPWREIAIDAVMGGGAPAKAWALAAACCLPDAAARWVLLVMACLARKEG